MKALIIENEYDVDAVIKAFLRDNPTLFETVEDETFCLNRKVEDLFQYIMKVDTIIIATTFMYKDQVIEYVEAFLKLPPTMKFNFFVHRCVRTFNYWGKAEEWQTEAKELRALIIKLIQAGHTIYDYAECWEGKEVKDEFNVSGIGSPKRRLFKHNQLHYDTTSDLFYVNDREYFDLKEMKDEYKS